MVPNTRVSGRTIYRMDREWRSGLMEVVLRAATKQGVNMGMGVIYGQTEVVTQVIGLKTKLVAKGDMTGLTVGAMRGIGLTITWTA
jgi:hypothetical protein